MGYVYSFANYSFISKASMIYFTTNKNDTGYINYLLGNAKYGPEGGFICSLLFFIFFLFSILLYLKIKTKLVSKNDSMKIIESLAEYKPSGFSTYSKLSNTLELGEDYDNKDEWKL